jgi:hypothetical protein
VAQVALAPEELPAEFVLEQLDGARERWLRDVALLGGAREIERARERGNSGSDAFPSAAPSRARANGPA